MWVVFACLSALFAGMTSILAKCGIKKTNSTVATAVRTCVVLVMAWVMVFLVGSQHTFAVIKTKTYIFLALSGICTGASWLCYFKALQVGNVNKVVALDKSSTVLTFILALIFFGERITVYSLSGMVLVSAGIFLMIEKKDCKSADNGGGWLIYAILSAVFASLTAILGKLGIDGVESNLGTALRTCVVLLMAWAMVFITGKGQEVKKIDRRELVFICLSGLATGASWLCYFKALRTGVTSAVVAIDKASILITIAFSFIVFKEKLSKKASIGLAVMIIGTACLVIGNIVA